MARGGRFGFNINYSDFARNLEVAVSRVERGTKKATIAACEEIEKMTLAQVPEETGTLSSSFFYEIEGKYHNFTAILGYGGNGDPIHPRTKKRASEYMIAVHEDLEAYHEKGKAKYLEDPVREYQSRFLPGAARAIRSELR